MLSEITHQAQQCDKMKDTCKGLLQHSHLPTPDTTLETKVALSAMESLSEHGAESQKPTGFCLELQSSTNALF